MGLIIDSKRFDICVVGAKDYKNVERYIIRYGLEVYKRDTLLEAMEEFNNCLNHAMQCEGLFDDLESE